MSVEPSLLAELLRPARALIAWLPHEQAVLFQTGGEMGVAVDPEVDARARAARAALEKRTAGLDQSDLVRPWPDHLREHANALRGNEAAQPYFAEGWEPAVVDLGRVVAFQPSVFIDNAEERASGIDADDLAAVAAISLPLPSRVALPAQFDEAKQAWILVSPNPNLRIVGNFGGELNSGVTGFGFVVRVMPSFLQVVEFNGRYLLRDGYHRAFGLLKRGIADVPAFVRTVDRFEQLGVSSEMLPQQAYLGDNPPTMLDYLDDEVSADVRLPSAQKMVLIQGLEIRPLG